LVSTTFLTAPSSSVLGQQVMMTATVSSSSATGNVTFYDGTTILGVRKLSGGTATLTTALLPTGVGALKAYYAGDTTYAASASTVIALTVRSLPSNGLNPPVSYSAGALPQPLVVADFNGDGKADLAVGDSQGNSVSVLLGHGDGSFQRALTYAVGGEPTSIAAGDFNGDGKPDVVLTYSNNVYLMLGNGDGTFQSPVLSARTASPLNSIAVGDFNGDGRADLVAANFSSNQGLVSVFLGNGDGTFQPAVSLAAGLGFSVVVLGDFNGDGKPDLAASNFAGGSVSVFLGNGDGTFQPQAVYQVGAYPTSIVVADFNGDSNTDLAVVSQSEQNISVFLGRGDGTFQPPKLYSVVPFYFASLAVGDINGDGVPDILAANQGGLGLNVLTGDGTGAFESAVVYGAGTSFYSVVPADLNGDGVNDLVLAAGNANSVNVFLGMPGNPDLTVVVNHTGNFSPGQSGATYSISVSNVGALPTSGTVTVSDSLPSGLTATAISGNGWTCALGNLTCTRSDVLAAATSYPAITLTVNVSANAPTGVTNSVAVSGGGEVNTANDSCSDFTTIFGPSQNAQWQLVTAPAPYNLTDHQLLLTDGTVAFHGYCSSDWYRLAPDAFGNYANGTWSPLASMPAGYGPLDYSSAVLADGRLVVIGGEFNETDNCQTEGEVSLGAIYEPRTNVWTPLAAPPGWSQVGEAPNVVLPDGSLLIGSQETTQLAKLDPATLTWTNLMSTNKADVNDEEGWVLLPDGTVLTVDYSYGSPPGSGLVGSGTHGETYNPLTDSWTPTGSTMVTLPETGGMVLRPDGTVFAPGDAHTAIYNYRTRTWSPGPDFPVVGGQSLDAGETGSALLPNGNVLVAEAHTDAASQTVVTFEFDGTHLNPAPNGNGGDTLLLPTGQVLVGATGGFSIYTPTGNPNPAWAPTISIAPGVIQNGQTYTITGTQFNGLSQGVGSGDERQAATNYPLVRVTNAATGHVFYCRTHDHSTMGVATGITPVSTHFDVPMSIESGPSTLVVVANGIPSSPVTVIVEPGGNSSLPSILPGGIVPVGSMSAIIQPGEWVSIYGTNLASATATWTGVFTTSLGGTSVMIDGKPAYLSYVSPGQINLQAPSDGGPGPFRLW
jgi:uncharacterized repeat protein (TIGR01451 family)